MDAMLNRIIDEVTAVLNARESTITETERASLTAALKGESDSLVCVIERQGRRGDHVWVALGPLDTDPNSYPSGSTGGSLPVARLVHSYAEFGSYDREQIGNKLRAMGGTHPDSHRLTTTQVASFFRSRTRNLPEAPRLKATIAVVSENSRATQAIGGDLPVAHTLGPAGFLYYDLDEVTVGHAVWRVSRWGTLRVFRREADGTWRAFVILKGARWASGMGDNFRGAMIAYRACRPTAQVA